MALTPNNIQLWVELPSDVAPGRATWLQWFSYSPIIPNTDVRWMSLSLAIRPWVDAILLPIVHVPPAFTTSTWTGWFYQNDPLLPPILCNGATPFTTADVLPFMKGLCVKRQLAGATGFRTNRIHIPGIPKNWVVDDALTLPKYNVCNAAVAHMKDNFTHMGVTFAPHIISYLGGGFRLSMKSVYCRQKLFTLLRRGRKNTISPLIQSGMKPWPP